MSRGVELGAYQLFAVEFDSDSADEAASAYGILFVYEPLGRLAQPIFHGYRVFLADLPVFSHGTWLAGICLANQNFSW